MTQLVQCMDSIHESNVHLKILFVLAQQIALMLMHTKKSVVVVMEASSLMREIIPFVTRKFIESQELLLNSSYFF